MRRTIRYDWFVGRECAPLVALAHLEGQSRHPPPWLSRRALGETPPLDGGRPGSRTAIAQPSKGFELCAVPGSGMFSAAGLFWGRASQSAVILLLLPADAIRIVVRLRRADSRRLVPGRELLRMAAHQNVFIDSKLPPSLPLLARSTRAAAARRA